MRIIRYKCSGRGADGWNFSEVEFGNLNLLVGDTATGKTRLLNTIVNLGSFVESDQFRNGEWDITFVRSGTTYRWEIEAVGEGGKDTQRIVRERLVRMDDESEHTLVERTADSFTFRDERLPKLAPQTTSIALLKEEEDIRPVFEGFEAISRRKFFYDELAQVAALEAISPRLIEGFHENPSVEKLYRSKLRLNVNLLILSKVFPEIFNSIRQHFKMAFSFIEDSAVRDLSDVAPRVDLAAEIPVFCIRERGAENWIPLPEISSGMQKVLLILTDTHILPNESIYIIDEYENSLGISAIDFFPDYLLELDKDIQFFLTSHHPYIINEIPPKNWYIFHRKGTNVVIRHGHEIESKFGKSKQKAFVQLINDPFYIEGVE